jgi:ribosomal protein S27AE
MPVPKHELDLETAYVTGVSLNEVRRVTSAFLECLTDHLCVHGSVRVPPVGVLSVNRYAYGLTKNGPPTTYKTRVTVRKSMTLANRLKEISMEKFGVDESLTAEDEKFASDDSKCPNCGDVLEKHGRVLKCPKCGTEPMEQDR